MCMGAKTFFAVRLLLLLLLLRLLLLIPPPRPALVLGSLDELTQLNLVLDRAARIHLKRGGCVGARGQRKRFFFEIQCSRLAAANAQENADGSEEAGSECARVCVCVYIHT
jgi:hypothetical protein